MEDTIHELSLIGYRGLTHEKFFGLLAAANTQVLLDVRRNPYSPNPDYQKQRLAEAAALHSVRYYHLPAIGVPGAGNSPIPTGSPRTIEAQLASQSGQKTLKRIVSTLRKENVTLMCAEPNYLDCHRPLIIEALRVWLPNLKIVKLTAVNEQRLF